MADVKLNPVFEAFSRKIGDLVFFQVNGKTHVRRKNIPSNPRTPEQLEVRSAFSELVNDWASLNGMMHLGWNAWAAKKRMKGNNAYLRENFEKQRAGEPVELFKQMGALRLTSFTAVPGVQGEITCTFEIEGGAEGRFIHFFTKRRGGEITETGFTMQSSEASPASPFALSGLETGGEYYVYAAVTDSAYHTSTEVSASIGVVCSAG